MNWNKTIAVVICAAVLMAVRMENITTPNLGDPGPEVGVAVSVEPFELSVRGDAEVARLDDQTIRLSSPSGNIAVGLGHGEAIYGLTERIVSSLTKSEHFPKAVGGLDRRGEVVSMWVRPTIAGYAPFYISSRGYGMYVEGTNPGEYDIGKTEPDVMRLTFYVEDEGLSCVFIKGSYLEILDRYTELTGRPVLPPRWVFRPWKWRGECKTDEFAQVDGLTINAEVADDILNYQKLDFPVGVYIVDRPWAEGFYGYGNFNWDENRFPNGDKMVKLMHDRGWHVVVWGGPWAIGDEEWEFGPEARSKGFIIGERCLDYTNPAAVRWHKEKIENFLQRSGVKGWKLDRADEYNPSRKKDIYHDGRNGLMVHNDYPRMFIKTYYDATRAVRGDDFVLLARPTYTGTQAWAVKWGGDTHSITTEILWISKHTDKGLRSVIISLQRMAMMGVPFWGSDTGGYHPFKKRELFARWLQVSAFCPIMEIGGKKSHEPWAMPKKPYYDTEMIKIYRRYTKLHTRLLDYTYELAKRAHQTGNPVVHPLVFDWPDDPKVEDMWDQYMYGPAILVAPVWETGKREREVYLPKGEWEYLWDRDKKFSGPTTITAKAPLDTIPVYVKTDREHHLPENLAE